MPSRTSWAAFGSTALFVLLWSSGAIFVRLGLDHSSAFAFLCLRFALALIIVLILRRGFGAGDLPPGMPLRIARAGVLLIGGYSILYALSLQFGVTPGVLVTVLGTQPILTLMALERGASPVRILGLFVAVAGLVLVGYDGFVLARWSIVGVLCAFGCLACATVGALLQKNLKVTPLDALPTQYAVSLVACLLIAPSQPLRVELSATFVISLLWLAIIISVAAQLLFYRLIQAGNLVNVTSTFYLVPVVTAALDYIFLGNRLSTLALLGLGAILLGVALVFSRARNAPVAAEAG